MNGNCWLIDAGGSGSLLKDGGIPAWPNLSVTGERLPWRGPYSHVMLSRDGVAFNASSWTILSGGCENIQSINVASGGSLELSGNGSAGNYPYLTRTRTHSCMKAHARRARKTHKFTTLHIRSYPPHQTPLKKAASLCSPQNVEVEVRRHLTGLAKPPSLA